MNRGLFRGVAGEVPYPGATIIDYKSVAGTTVNMLEIGNASLVRLNGGITLNGMVPGYPGQIVTLYQWTGNTTVTHASASAAEECKFRNGQGSAVASLTLRQGMFMMFIYDSFQNSGLSPGWHPLQQLTATVDGTGMAGTYGSATASATFTLDSYGRITTATTTAITGVTPSAHASTHQNGGSDEIATTTAAANAIPKADAIGFLNPAWEGILSCSADQTIANSSTLTTSSYMTFAVSAATKYRVEGLIIADTTAAGDFKYSLTNPGSPTLIRYFESRAAAGATPAFTAPLAAYPAGVSLTATTSNGVYINFWSILHNGANAGNVAFQFAQNSTTNDAGATVRAGSYIKYAIA